MVTVRNTDVGALIDPGASEAIDVASRTLLAELEVDNTTGELLPGAFVQVSFKLPSAASTWVLPVSAVIFRGDGVRVAVVQRDSTVVMTPVTLGRDFGTEVEVLDGIGADTIVVVSPPDSLVDKQLVRVFQNNGGAGPDMGAASGTGRAR